MNSLAYQTRVVAAPQSDTLEEIIEEENTPLSTTTSGITRALTVLNAQENLARDRDSTG
jgi:hypothetical protein